MHEFLSLVVIVNVVWLVLAVTILIFRLYKDDGTFPCYYFISSCAAVLVLVLNLANVRASKKRSLHFPKTQSTTQSQAVHKTRQNSTASKPEPKPTGPQHTCRKVFVNYESPDNPGVKAMVEKTVGTETCPACIVQRKQIQTLMREK